MMMNAQDQQQLKLLEILYYVGAGFAGFFALVPIIHLVVGILMLKGVIPLDEGGEAAPAFIGWLFIGLAITFMIFGWTLCVLMIFMGRFLGKRKRYTFCFVVAVISCLFMPLGTILGIFTIIVLSRPAVKEAFDAAAA